MQHPETHLDEGTIHGWLDGALAPDEAARVESHVGECAECAAAVAEARGLIAAASRILTALDGVPSGVIPQSAEPASGSAAAGAASVAPPQVLELGRARESRRRRFRLTDVRAAAAAMVLIAGAAVVSQTLRTSDPRRGDVVSVAARESRAAAQAPAPATDVYSAAPTPAPSAPPAAPPAVRPSTSKAASGPQLNADGLAQRVETRPSEAQARAPEQYALRRERAAELRSAPVNASGATSREQKMAEAAPPTRDAAGPRADRVDVADQLESSSAYAQAAPESTSDEASDEAGRIAGDTRLPAAGSQVFSGRGATGGAASARTATSATASAPRPNAAPSAAMAKAAPTRGIAGRVVDASTGRPLASVTVSLLGQPDGGTVTDANGRYALADAPRGLHVLIARMVGYGAERRRVRVSLDSARAVDFAMRPNALTLSEVVVTGAGQPARRKGIEPPFAISPTGCYTLRVGTWTPMLSRDTLAALLPSHIVLDTVSVSEQFGPGTFDVHAGRGSTLRGRGYWSAIGAASIGVTFEAGEGGLDLVLRPSGELLRGEAETFGEDAEGLPRRAPVSARRVTCGR